MGIDKLSNGFFLQVNIAYAYTCVKLKQLFTQSYIKSNLLKTHSHLNE